MRRSPIIASLIFIAALMGDALPGDYWMNSSEAGVATNNDCGVVTEVYGTPIIRRSFMTREDRGITLYPADRLNAGDEVQVPADSLLELVSGNNVVVVLGPGAKAKFSGLRTFVHNNSTRVTRLDLQLLAGSARIQVRLNQERPESILFALDGAEVLLTRGDAEISAEGGWYAAALAGNMDLRLKRGNIAGASFTLQEGTAIGNTGEAKLDADTAQTIQRRLPFSFETISAALPPRPPMGSPLEAP